MFYFSIVGGRLVLLHAFTVQSPQTPPDEVEVALQRMGASLREELEREPG